MALQEKVHAKTQAEIDAHSSEIVRSRKLERRRAWAALFRVTPTESYQREYLI